MQGFSATRPWYERTALTENGWSWPLSPTMPYMSYRARRSSTRLSSRSGFMEPLAVATFQACGVRWGRVG